MIIEALDLNVVVLLSGSGLSMVQASEGVVNAVHN